MSEGYWEIGPSLPTILSPHSKLSVSIFLLVNFFIAPPVCNGRGGKKGMVVTTHIGLYIEAVFH